MIISQPHCWRLSRMGYHRNDEIPKSSPTDDYNLRLFFCFLVKRINAKEIWAKWRRGGYAGSSARDIQIARVDSKNANVMIGVESHATTQVGCLFVIFNWIHILIVALLIQNSFTARNLEWQLKPVARPKFQWNQTFSVQKFRNATPILSLWMLDSSRDVINWLSVSGISKSIIVLGYSARFETFQKKDPIGAMYSLD